MTSFVQFTCNLCFKPIHIGYTACYMPNKMDDNNTGTYRLSSIETGLNEMKKQSSAAGALISHICNDCANDIYKQVYSDKSKAAK